MKKNFMGCLERRHTVRKYRNLIVVNIPTVVKNVFCYVCTSSPLICCSYISTLVWYILNLYEEFGLINMNIIILKGVHSCLFYVWVHLLYKTNTIIIYWASHVSLQFISQTIAQPLPIWTHKYKQECRLS